MAPGDVGQLDGQFFTVRAVAGHMKARRTGSIVFCTSSVSMTRQAATPSAARQAGLTAMARGLAVELARDGIRVSAIVPGWTVAAMTRGHPVLGCRAGQDPAAGSDTALGTPQDFEGLAVWLAGSGSGYFTGQTVVMDGDLVF